MTTFSFVLNGAPLSLEQRIQNWVDEGLAGSHRIVDGDFRYTITLDDVNDSMRFAITFAADLASSEKRSAQYQILREVYEQTGSYGAAMKAAGL